MTTPPNTPADDSFDQLVAGYFDQTLSEAELERFLQMLGEDDACMRRFAELAQLNQMIGREVVDQQRHILVAGSLDPEDASDTGIALVLMNLARLEAQATPELVTLDPGPGPAASAARGSSKENATTTHDNAPLSPREIASATGYLLGRALISRPARRAYAYAAAALVLLAALWLIPWNDNTPTPQTSEQPPRTTTPDRPVVATLTSTHHAQWAEQPAERALARGSKLHPSTRLTLTAGFAEITTARGAIAILQAPATIELTDSDNALRLHAGKLVGICETPSSKGFVVKTDHADITDLGTEFGVYAHDTGTDTTVFTGEVAVKTPNAPPKTITHNQTARIAADTGTPTLIVEDNPAAGFARRMPRAPLITDASINLPGFTVEVVPNGVYEDIKLHTDRDHELNGFNADGLPGFLIGGDLVRMPSSARPDRNPQIGNRLQLQLELDRPSDIYVLIPEIAKTEAWLQRDYDKTRFVAGNDLAGHTGVGETVYERGVGPGNSIEEALAIWKRKQPAHGRTAIAGAITNSMYTVIAVPHKPGHPTLNP